MYFTIVSVWNYSHTNEIIQIHVDNHTWMSKAQLIQFPNTNNQPHKNQNDNFHQCLSVQQKVKYCTMRHITCLSVRCEPNGTLNHCLLTLDPWNLRWKTISIRNFAQSTSDAAGDGDSPQYNFHGSSDDWTSHMRTPDWNTDFLHHSRHTGRIPSTLSVVS